MNIFFLLEESEDNVWIQKTHNIDLFNKHFSRLMQPKRVSAMKAEEISYKKFTQKISQTKMKIFPVFYVK